LQDLLKKEFPEQRATPSQIYSIIQEGKYKLLQELYSAKTPHQLSQLISSDLHDIAAGTGKKQKCIDNKRQKRREILAQIVKREGTLETITTFELTEAIRSKYFPEEFKDFLQTNPEKDIEKRKKLRYIVIKDLQHLKAKPQKYGL